MTKDHPLTIGEQSTISVRRKPGEPIQFCDGRGLKRLIGAGLAWLERHQAAINALNVYPVPDGDTGTNMLLTMQSAYQEIQDSPEEEVSVIAQKVAHGALMGARGNSGVILSQIFRGFARSLEGVQAFDTVLFAAALREAAAMAYKGVIKPVEGTILTVAREASEAAVASAAGSKDLTYVLERVVHEARDSVTRTPTLLPVLAEAGVVDAGGQGLFIILEGMLRYSRGERLTVDTELAAVMDLQALDSEGEEGYGYDVQFIIHGEALDVEEIRETIASLGDSALVVGDSRAVKVHVHSPEPGTPINYGVSVGSISRVIVENMQEQYQDFILSKAQKPVAPPEPLSGIGTVVVAPGQGLVTVFESLGASIVVPGGQTMNPSTEELLNAVKSTPSEDVIILPNNKNIVMAAEQAKALSEKRVEVVPTITVPQGISALLALNYQADLATNARIMAEAAETIETAEVTTAVRSVKINGISVLKGQVIGLVNGKLKVKGSSPADVVMEALAIMNIEDYEIITIYYGDSIATDEAQQLADNIINQYPDQEVEVVDGGQPHYHYIVSAE
ncbi:MAG TPA: DAK2 domain-containing protein [Anaerolineae bacterium]|nr:DAK2 domain-containing protein [Anaerolineae bacterium]